MKSTRELILQTLSAKYRCTISELAEEVGINPISVRHHIAKLEGENFVSSEEERRGVGRPRRVYFLTSKGLEKFSSPYIQMTNHLLKQIKTCLDDRETDPFFIQICKDIVYEHVTSQALDQMSLEERLNQLREILATEGICISWKDKGDYIQLSIDQCPYDPIAQKHHEICTIDFSIIAETLRIAPQFIQYISESKNPCRYLIRKQLGATLP